MLETKLSVVGTAYVSFLRSPIAKSLSLPWSANVGALTVILFVLFVVPVAIEPFAEAPPETFATELLPVVFA